MAGDLVYAIGGFNGSARIRSVEIYDPRRYACRLTRRQCRLCHLVNLRQWFLYRDLWLTGPPMEARRSTLGVAVLEGTIIAVGGFDGSTGLCSAEMLDPRQGISA